MPKLAYTLYSYCSVNAPTMGIYSLYFLIVVHNLHYYYTFTNSYCHFLHSQIAKLDQQPILWTLSERASFTVDNEEVYMYKKCEAESFERASL